MAAHGRGDLKEVECERQALWVNAAKSVAVGALGGRLVKAGGEAIATRIATALGTEAGKESVATLAEIAIEKGADLAADKTVEIVLGEQPRRDDNEPPREPH
jgi:hypothetical protein